MAKPLGLTFTFSGNVDSILIRVGVMSAIPGRKAKMAKVSFALTKGKKDCSTKCSHCASSFQAKVPAKKPCEIYSRLRLNQW